MRNLKGVEKGYKSSGIKRKKKGKRGSSEFYNDKHLKHNRKVVGNSLIKGRREG